MSIIEALFLGLIQGITEFLPVSSSGHLVLFQNILGLKNLKEYIVFDVICHLGTLLAIFLVFAKEIKELLFKDHKTFLKIVVAILPLFPLLLLMKPIKAAFEQPQYLGYFFLTTAALLYLGIRFGQNKPDNVLEKRSYKDAFIIGLFQAMAILPGVSRSGSTISGARLLGWNYDKAITFSFLLAIPTILGGVTIELGQLLFKSHAELPSIAFTQYAAGFITSFFFGWGSLLFLQKLATKHKFMYFVWYCLFIGLVTILYFRNF
jgi:undecaprenyl-diphosphatase